MASFKKYKMSAVYALLDHDSRAKTAEKENIDKSRSYLNYNFISEDSYERARNRIRYAKEHGAILRDNSVIVVQYLMTLPKNFPKNEELEYEFFRANFNYIKKLFGEENIISATVHKDESQPHIHINFCPIVSKIKTYKDGSKKERIAFDAKNLINKNFLKSFHKELGDYLEDWLGFRPNIENGATKRGNKTIEELKEISEAKKAAEQVLKMTPRELAEMKKEQNEFKEHRAELWEDYKENSQIYWSWYKTEKQKINNQLWEISKEVKQAEKDLERSLDLFSNMSQGFLYAIFSFIGSIFKKIHKDRLKKDQERLKGILEEMNKQRRTISNHQHNTREALKREDLEKVEILLEHWEQALNKTHMNIKASMEMKTGLFEQHREETALQVDFDMIK